MARFLRSNIILIVAIGVALAILINLGNWQVRRLAWKESLIERVEQQLASPPRPLGMVVEQSLADASLAEYAPVAVRGTFLQAAPVYEFTTHKGQSGWHVFHQFKLANGDEIGDKQIVVVNRGFIPYEARESDEVAQYPDGEKSIHALFRNSLTKKPGYFVLENELEARTFHWRDIGEMARLMGGNGSQITAFYLDVGLPDEKPNLGVLPVAGTTRIAFSNNHLGYVITWYGLALSLVGVGGWFLFSRWRKAHAV